MAGTSIGCGGAFLFGLRLVRSVVNTEHITPTPIIKDVQLSTSIGGATGCFVCTDVSYLPDQNILKPFIGISDLDEVGLACAKAGLSTSIGFGSVQAFQNIGISNGKCWTD